MIEANAPAIQERAHQETALAMGRLQGETGPLATISYAYDELGRVLSSTVDSVNADSVSYDSLDRVTGALNPLGSFTYSYGDATPRLLWPTARGALATCLASCP